MRSACPARKSCRVDTSRIFLVLMPFAIFVSLSGQSPAESVRCGRLRCLRAGRLIGRDRSGIAALGRHEKPGVLDAVFPRVDHLHDGVGGLRVAGAGRQPLRCA